MEFKQRLKKLRKEHGFKQVQLGKALNYGSTTISNYERGRNRPSIEDLIRLAEVFNVSVDYLIGKSECKNLQVPLGAERKTGDFLQMYLDYNEVQLSLLQNYMKCLKTYMPMMEDENFHSK